MANLNRSPVFQTLEFAQTSWTRWAGSLALHTILAVLVIAIPWSVRDAERTERRPIVPLTEPAPRPTPPRVSAPPLVTKRVPPPPLKHAIEFKAPPPRPLAVERRVVVQEPPAAPQLPKQEMAKLDLPKIEPPQIQRPVPAVKTGGFGNPEGALPSPTASEQKAAAPKIGSFDLAAGESHGRGSPVKQVASAGFADAGQASTVSQGNGHGSARMAGFGDSTTGAGTGSGGNGHGPVHTGGFGAYETAPPPAHAARPSTPLETPVEITYKPKPAYTAEAREKRIEGEVLLEVLFAANGQVHVLRVTRGLGFGLDESARAAAAQIRFQPGTRDGAPVDMKGTVHIVFELS